MFSKMKYILCLLSIFISPQSLQAFSDCSNCGRWGIEAEWLYFRPSIDTFLATRVTSSSPPTIINSKQVIVRPDYHSGWRIGAFYRLCDGSKAIEARWTQLNTRDKKTFSGPAFQFFFGSVAGTPALAEDELKFDYNAFEAVLSFLSWRGCRYDLNLLAGIEYATLEVKEQMLLTGGLSPALLNQKGRFWGIGPELGFRLNFCVWNGFSLVAEGRGALLASKIKESIRGELLSGSFRSSFDADPIWRLVPMWDFRTGLRYQGCLNCFNYYLEGGYELISFFKSLHLMDTNFSSQLIYSNVDFHGPYIAAGFAF